MPSAAQAIIDKAKGALNDPEAVHWPLPELVGYLNDAQSATVLARPEANPKVIQMKLEPGTRQKIPDGDGAAADIRPVGIKAYSLIDVVRNMGRNGATPGRAIRPCGRETLDQCNPSWHSDPASDTTINFIYDTRNRETFYVWPAATGAAWIEMVIAVSPKQIELAVGDDGSVSLPGNRIAVHRRSVRLDDPGIRPLPGVPEGGRPGRCVRQQVAELLPAVCAELGHFGREGSGADDQAPDSRIDDRDGRIDG